MNHNYDPADDLPFYTVEELEEMKSEARRADEERSIPTPAERNRGLR